MPGFAKIVAELNQRFHPDNISAFSKNKDAFGPGRPLDAGLVVDPGTEAHRLFSAYLQRLPKVLHDALRAVIYQALSDPPTQITFAWAPAYSYEMTIWPADCGITVLFKSRYPSDRMPAVSDEAR